MYVDGVSGSNSNSGTQEEPWQTLQFAIDQVGPGDTIFVRDGIYSEKVSFDGAEDSGSEADGFVTLTAFPGETPVIDGQVLTPDGREGLISIRDAEYVRVSAIEIRDFTTTSASDTPVGIYVEGRSNHLEILDNTVHGIRQLNPSDGGAHGIGVFGTDASAAAHELLFRGNEVFDCNLMWSEAFVLNGNVRGFELRENIVHDCDNIAFDFIGYEGECGGCSGDFGDNVDRARDGLVVGNLAYAIDTIVNPVYEGQRSAAGFYVDGGANIVFERNVSRQNNLGIELASEHFGRATEQITVRNNFVLDCHVLGIATGGYSSGNGPGGGEARDNTVVNNTLYRNTTSDRPEDNWGAEILLQSRNIDNLYKNNIVVARSGKRRVAIDGAMNSGNVWGTQLYFGSDQGSTPGVVSTDDPQLVDPSAGDLHIQPGSPALNLGEALPETVIGTEDIDGDPRVSDGFVDLGADELDSATEVSILEEGPSSPFDLSTAPNPVRGLATISYRLPEASRVTLQVCDVQGRVVRTRAPGTQSPGLHEWSWDRSDDSGRSLPAGTYFVRLRVGAWKETVKLLIAE